MPNQLENPKGTLLLGYLEPDSSNEHLNLRESWEYINHRVILSRRTIVQNTNWPPTSI